MKEAILELAHREYTMGDYANAEIHCKQVNHVTGGVTYRVKTYDGNDRFFGLTLILEVSELPISSRSDVSGSELSGQVWAPSDLWPQPIFKVYQYDKTSPAVLLLLSSIYFQKKMMDESGTITFTY